MREIRFEVEVNTIYFKKTLGTRLDFNLRNYFNVPLSDCPHAGSAEQGDVQPGRPRPPPGAQPRHPGAPLRAEHQGRHARPLHHFQVTV